MNSDTAEDEPTVFSKKTNNSGYKFATGSGRGTASAPEDALAIQNTENTASYQSQNLGPSTALPEAQTDDNVEQLAAISLSVFTTNPGLALAAPIFNSLYRVVSNSNINPDQLHQQFANMLRRYETQLVNKGFSEKRVRLMLYGLAATVDDIILQNNWAFDSRWSQESMISLFYRETWGGERFFTILKEMMSSASSFIRELELYYFCIQFGFEGRYRLASRDRELNQIREELFNIVRDSWGALPFELSPTWKGTNSFNPKPRILTNFWYWALFSLIVIGALYIIFANLLHTKSEIAINDLNTIVTDPSYLAEQTKTTPEVATPPAAEPRKPSEDDLLNQISVWQNGGQIKITKDKNKIIIATTKELFASGSTNLRSPYPQLIQEVAQMLNKLQGSIDVIGYTDNVPIRSQKYPDNMALSIARAQTVANLIASYLTAPSRVSSKGMGSNDPIAPNTTPEGRLANRRVDIILTAP